MTEVCKEKPNAAAVGAYSAALGNGASKSEASKAASNATDGEAKTDTSNVVKRQVESLYKEHERLEQRWKSGSSLTNSQYEEQSAAILRRIESLEQKHGVLYKDAFLKASGKGRKKRR